MSCSAGHTHLSIKTGFVTLPHIVLRWLSNNNPTPLCPSLPVICITIFIFPPFAFDIVIKAGKVHILT